MFLALREMARAKVRFGLLVAALGLLVFLILFQQSLRDGLISSFIGAVENQNAPVLVYSLDGQRVIQGSVMTAELESLVETTPGVGAAARVGQGTFTGVPDGGDERFDTTIIGYEASVGLGAPETLVTGRLPAAPGEAVASEASAPDGFDVGDSVTILPGGTRVTIVGLARNAQLNASPTLFTHYDTWVDVTTSVNPDAGTPVPNIMAVSPAEGVSPDALVEAINERSPDLDALTRSDAAAETPGVSQVQQSFSIIFGLYGLVVPCITGLFFLIVTFQKAGALTLLRAIGAPAHRLVTSLLIQVTIIVVSGYALGTLLYTPLSRRRIGGIQLSFETAAVVGWAIALTVLALVSAAFAARRVLRIDPIEATTGAGVGT
ncbi:MAG: ABC transporter permease [Acidimicrobiales bacterium]